MRVPVEPGLSFSFDRLTTRWVRNFVIKTSYGSDCPATESSRLTCMKNLYVRLGGWFKFGSERMLSSLEFS